MSFITRFSEVVTVQIPVPCGTCDGTGKVDIAPHDVDGKTVTQDDCPTCTGKGLVPSDEFWAKVARYPSRNAYGTAQNILMAPTMTLGTEEGQASKTEGLLDTTGYANELVAWQLREWNLTDENEQVKPIGTCDPNKGPDSTRRAAVAWLPEDAFEALQKAIDGTRKVAKKGDGIVPTDPFRKGRPSGPVPGEAGAA